MAPSKLKRHITTKHHSPICKDMTYLRRSRKQQEKHAIFMTSLEWAKENVHVASYTVAELDVKAKKPHTLPETLCMSACKEKMKIGLGQYAAREISEVPPSADTIGRRVSDMWSDIKVILGERN
jgi:hypothetical protein